MILAVKVDQVNQQESLKIVEGFLKKNSKHYITTPNLEIIKIAQEDQNLKKILNSADLAIPDSSRLGWLKTLSEEKNFFKRLLIFPRGFLPFFKNGLIYFDVVTGVDFMDSLCKLSSEKGYTVGLLGAASGVAENTAECLRFRYPNLKVSFVSSGDTINEEELNGQVSSMKYLVSSEDKKAKSLNTKYQIPNTDILFVALGQGKQEKWISQNLEKIPVKVAMTVGGAFDYLSGSVPRAPLWMRQIGMEWLFRLMMQPWRIGRQLSLVKYLLSLLFK
jgi:N-acetylglucosaminyldiphosphoundecaprenol N-acetyl-beta-D-mannosaminyltransferase